MTATDHARQSALASYDTINAMIATLENDTEYKGQDASEAILEHPLSIKVRSDWHTPGDGHNKPTEYAILITYGGPSVRISVRITGDLDEHSQPTNAYLQYQGWGIPWQTVYEGIDADTLLKYANQFYFGE